MRSAAREHRQDEPPDPPGPEQAAGLISELAALAGSAGMLQGRVAAGEASRDLMTELVVHGVRLAESADAMRTLTAALAEHEFVVRQTWAAATAAAEERARAASASAPAARHGHRRASRWQETPGQRALFSVKGIAIAALLGLGKVLRHGQGHGAAAKLTAYHLKLAAVVTASTATLAIGGAVVITHYAGSPPSGSPGSQGAASVPARHTSATPIPSSSLIALTKPKPKHAAKGKRLDGSGLPLLCCSPEPSSSASQSSAAPSVQASVQAGPAVLTVSTTALDLTSLTSETITLSATGAGWVSWKVVLPPDPLTGAPQTDLDFSATHGVLQAGQSVTVTVSLDQSQLQDGNLSETFVIGGVSVRATLPPLTVPVASASALPSLPGL